MKLVRMGAAILLATSASFVGAAEIANATPLCDATSLTVQIPQPNPYDEVADGELPEPSGVGFHVTLRQVEGMSALDFDPKMPVANARNQGLSEPLTSITNDDARATFTGISEGVYVVSVSAPEDSRFKKAIVDDFLVSVPVGDQCLGEVDAKIRYDEPTPPTPTPPTPDTPTQPKNPLPQTGARIAGIGLLGAVVALTGMALLRSRRTHTRGGNL